MLVTGETGAAAPPLPSEAAAAGAAVPTVRCGTFACSLRIWEWLTLGAAWPLVMSVVAVSFFHWFKPSEPYLVDILVHSFGIPVDVVYEDVFPVSSWAMLPMTVVGGLIFEWFGFPAALMVVSLADAATTALVLIAGALAASGDMRGALVPLYMSQVTFGLSFSLVFVAPAGMFQMLPPGMYQRATSWTRSVTLLGTILSAALGQALVTGGLNPTVTLWGSLFGTSASLLLALLAWARGWLNPPLSPAPVVPTSASPTAPPPPTTTPTAGVWGSWGYEARASTPTDTRATALTPQRPSLLAEMRQTLAVYKDGQVLLWSVWSALLRGVHTLVLIYWLPLLDLQGSSAESGAIYAAAYALAAIVTALPAFLEQQPWFAPAPLMAAGTAIAGGSLLTMSSTIHGLPTASFILFHALTEGLLALSSATLGRAIAQAPRPRRKLSTPAPQSGRTKLGGEEATEAEVGDEERAPSPPGHGPGTERHPLLIVPEESEDDVVVGVEGRAEESRPKFAALLALNLCAGMLFQMVLQAAVTGHAANLSLRDQFAVYGAIVMVTAAAGTGGAFWLSHSDR